MKTRKILYAESGMVLTDGREYNKIFFLADDRQESEFHEITEAEYEKILKEKEELK